MDSFDEILHCRVESLYLKGQTASLKTRFWELSQEREEGKHKLLIFDNARIIIMTDRTERKPTR